MLWPRVDGSTFVGEWVGAMDLSSFDNRTFNRGRAGWVELSWKLIEALFIRSWIPGSAHRVWWLRRFGARIGRGVVAKPGLRIKFPWRLSVGDYSWLGEDVWIDNLAHVSIGSHCCISQGAYLCTGNHDWSSFGFDLITKPIRIDDGVWVGAFARIAPGLSLDKGAVVGLGAVLLDNATANTVYTGNPAVPDRKKTIGQHRRSRDESI